MKVIRNLAVVLFCSLNAVSAQDYKSITNRLLQEGILLAEARGDLNRDGREDLILAVQYGLGDQEVRCLYLFTAEAEADFREALQTRKALMLSSEGGVWGEPLDSITVSRNSLFIRFYGGSRWKWSLSYQFQYRQSDWYLIGHDSSSVDSFTGEGKTESYNLLNGKLQVIESADETHSQEVWIQRGPKKLVSLRDFDIQSSEKQF